LTLEMLYSPTNPEISIIITAYNVANYIEQAVLSVVEGTSAQHCEVIVVDDGSTDGTKEIIESIAGKFEHIQIIRFEKNTPGGVGRAANAGIDKATGAFIGFLDGDDLALPGAFDRLLSSIQTADSDIALCDYERLHAETGELDKSGDWHIWQSISQKNKFSGEAVNALLKLQVYPWRKLYRASFLTEQSLRFPEVDTYFEDSVFHWNVCLAAKSAAICDFSGFHYRVARSGQTINTTGNIRRQTLSYAPELKGLATRRNCQQSIDAYLYWSLAVLGWVGIALEDENENSLQQEAIEMLEGFSTLRIASALGRIPDKRGIFLPQTRSFSAVVWLRLGVPNFFRRRMKNYGVTLFEALVTWGLVLISPKK